MINELILKFTKVYEVHSIPGRLRVKAPGLNLVEKYVNKNILDQFLERYLLKGVISVEVSFISNGILIYYRPDEINKDTIISFLNRLRVRIIELSKSDMESLDNQMIEKVYNDFRKEGYEFT